MVTRGMTAETTIVLRRIGITWGIGFLLWLRHDKKPGRFGRTEELKKKGERT